MWPFTRKNASLAPLIARISAIEDRLIAQQSTDDRRLNGDLIAALAPAFAKPFQAIADGMAEQVEEQKRQKERRALRSVAAATRKRSRTGQFQRKGEDRPSCALCINPMHTSVTVEMIQEHARHGLPPPPNGANGADAS